MICPSLLGRRQLEHGRGDAEFGKLIPPGEDLNRYVFFTDPTYPETSLVLVRNEVVVVPKPD